MGITRRIAKAAPVSRLYCALCGQPHQAAHLKADWIAFRITYGLNGRGDIAGWLLCPDCRNGQQGAEQPELGLEYGG